MSCDVAVIGAGVSGLACAHDLAARGLKVQILERQQHTGGNAHSLRFDGFLMELGPTTLNAALPEAGARLDALGLSHLTIPLGAGVQKRYLRDASGLHGISTHPLGFFMSDYLSPTARLSLLAEGLRRRRRRGGDETVHGFVRRRFGREFADKVIEPMAAGIFMGDAHRLSINGAFPKLAEMEQRYGSVLRGILAAKRHSEPGRALFSWPEGIATLPRALAAQMRAQVRCGTTVTRISRSAGEFRIETARHGTLNARAVVLAVQPHVVADLIAPLDADAGRAAAGIAAPPVAVVFFGYRRAQVAHPLDGLGFLSTRRPDQAISGGQFASTMFTGRAPDGHVAISCYVGGARRPDLALLPAPELIDLVRAELSDLLGITGDAVMTRAHHWPRGLPQYTLGHAQRRDVLSTSSARLPGLHVTGNFLTGVSVTHCLASARLTATRVAADLGMADDSGLPSTPQTAVMARPREHSSLSATGE